MSGKKRVSYMLDRAKLSAMAPPLLVRLSRIDDRPGMAPEPITLPGEGKFDDASGVLGIENIIPGVTGGGQYEAQVEDFNKQTLVYRFMIPGPHLPNPKAASDIASARALNAAVEKSATEQAQAALGMPSPTLADPRQQPFSFAAPQVQPMTMPQQTAPGTDPFATAPPGVNPSAWATLPLAQRQALWAQINTANLQQAQAALYGAPPGAVPGGGLPAFGMPFPGAPYGQPSWPQGYGWPTTLTPPQYIPQFGDQGDNRPSAKFEAKLEALAAENQRLREQATLKQASEGAERVASQQAEMLRQIREQNETSRREAREIAEQSNKRFEQLIEKLAGRNAGPSEETTSRYAELERKLLAAEAARANDAMRSELQALRDTQARETQGLQQQMAAAREKGNNDVVMQLMSQGREQAERHMTALSAMLERSAKQPDLLATMAAMKQLTTSERDPLIANILQAGLEALQGGSAPPVAAQIAGSVLDAGREITKTIINAGVDRDTAKIKAKAQAEAQLRQVANNARQPQRQPQLNGTAQQATQPTNGAHHEAPPSPPAPADIIDPGTGEIDEAKYFSVIYPHVLQARRAIASGAFDDPERLVELIVAQYIGNVGDWNLGAPVFADLLNPEMVHRAVTMAFPETPAAFRQKMIELLPPALAEAIEEFKKEVAEAAAERQKAGEDAPS